MYVFRFYSIVSCRRGQTRSQVSKRGAQHLLWARENAERELVDQGTRGSPGNGKAARRTPNPPYSRDIWTGTVLLTEYALSGGVMIALDINCLRSPSLHGKVSATKPNPSTEYKLSAIFARTRPL